MNKKNDIYKMIFKICLIVFVIGGISWIVAMVSAGTKGVSLSVNLIHLAVLGISGEVGLFFLAKEKNQVPIIFEPEAYKYSPEDKKKLSLDETMYYLHDKFIMKMFYGIFLFFWGIGFICCEVGLFVIEGATIVEAVIINIVLFAVLLLVTGFFGLMLYVTRRNGAKYALNTNRRKNVDIKVDDFLKVVEQDLYKGMRFRSPKLILTEQFILGTLGNGSLAPIAIPVNQVKKIRYSVRRYGWPTGKRYMEAKFYFDLYNGNTVLLYVNYVKWEIVVQMFKYYGFNI